jgi:carboxyl-terminal processing protease
MKILKLLTSVTTTLLLASLTLILSPQTSEAKLPELTPQNVTAKVKEIMKAHASYKVLNDVLVRRILQNYVEELDPNKTYFIESDISTWLHPSDALVQQVLTGYTNSDYTTFEKIHDLMAKAIQRRHQLEAQINLKDLPAHVNMKEFKDLKWAQNEQELLKRLSNIKALQIESSMKLNEDIREKALQRITKRQAKYEESFTTTDAVQRKHLILSNVLKATTSSLDAHTAYFTPDEASQFMINVQQRLYGIGAQLRDDISGFTVIKIIEGGPAANGKELKVKDRIIAVNSEPVVGMDIVDAVDLIRGEENTPVTLTVIREVKSDVTANNPDSIQEEKLDIIVHRGEVVLKESRFETSYEPYGDGVIGYLRLYSFYQDLESASATDLANEIKKLKKEHKLKGIILDLRYNSGGLLAQAVDVTGLFITKGVVVSIKDHTGDIQHLRELTGKTSWDGPLLVLVNRASASASEIVAQTLQDYGRALVVGDDHTYGKGSFQTFTLNTSHNATVNPQGEYKVTRGRYYTVSGKTPQLTGVISDVVVPGMLSEIEIGETFAKNPLENDRIKPNFEDDLSDIPYMQRDKIRLLYKFDLQPKLTIYQQYVANLQKNSEQRIGNNKNYQNFLKELKKEDDFDAEDGEKFGQNDLQLAEAYNVMKDVIFLLHSDAAMGS